MKKNTADSSELSPFKREIFSIFLLAIGIFLYLSLLSFYPFDPSFQSLSTAGPIQNWGGVLGAYLSDALLFLFGGGAYFVGLFFVLSAVLMITGVKKNFKVNSLLLYLLFVVFVAVLFQLIQKVLTFGEIQIEAGGLFGGLVAHFGESYLGTPGTYLLVIFGGLITFVWATHLSVKNIFFTSVAGLKSAGLWLAGRFQMAYSRLNKASAKWWKKFKENREVQKARAELKSKQKTLTINKKPSPPKPQPLSEPVTAEEPGDPVIFERQDSKKPKKASPQLKLLGMDNGYELPSINLLDANEQESSSVDEENLKMNAKLLEKKLLDFNVEGKVTEIHPGPVITMYEFEPAPGVKLSKIANLTDDLCLAMGGRSVRVVAPLPDKAAVGIEIPNRVRETVWLKEILSDTKFQNHESKLVFALGKDIEGTPYVSDLTKMPHLLVAGATGSGKSVSINSMIMSILYKASPSEVRLIMVDPKMLELSIYEGIPHLLLPVVTEPKKATLALKWALREMERRYKLLADINARNIQNYNRKITDKNFVSKQAAMIKEKGLSVSDDDLMTHEEKLPFIVIIIDELADLMMVAGRDVEESITRLAQMARAAGIHLILATQRPSVDVITGIIKANFPSRVAFKVSAKHDSRTILDTIGAERLLGAGDMLYVPPGAARILRLHGAFVSDAEVGRVVEQLKKQGKPVYNESILKPVNEETGSGDSDDDTDELYDQAISIVAETKQASISMIQRKLRVGYNRAARMIEKMETDGIVSPASGAGHRQVLVSSFE